MDWRDADSSHCSRTAIGRKQKPGERLLFFQLLTQSGRLDNWQGACMNSTTIKNATLIAAIIFHFILVGATLFGDIVIVPVVLSAPPESLTIFQGQYAYDSTGFWQPVNMIALGLLLAALFANWRTSRRGLLIGWLIGTVVVTIWSLAFIFPEYVDIVSTPFESKIDLALVERGARWSVISNIRLAIFVVIGLLPFCALTKQP